MQYFDVVIVGAGLSGIGSAFHLRNKCPGKTYAIFESRDAIGGTWDLFRYPGIRSDSDMHTLGYNFKPWKEAKAIADGPAIWNYVNETADENHIREHIRFKHKVTDAAWSTDDARWTVTAKNLANGEDTQYQCNMLLMCSGYYNYQQGYTPEFAGREDFKGTIVHPQFWPEDLDYTGKRVVVIGSGATAMTLVPSMAQRAQQVTMVQRSPTYVVSRPEKDAIANALRRFLPERWAYALTRFKNVTMGRYIYNQTRTNPGKIKKRLISMVRDALGEDFDVDTHFTPNYNPWDQRLCLIPDADLFKAIRKQKVTVVTSQIDGFTQIGLRLSDGTQIEADIIVTATGLELQLLGGAEFSVDGVDVEFPSTFSYKGMLYSDVPNLVQTFGYINASWTLRADLTAEYVTRLINHMDQCGMRQVTPRILDKDRNMQARPWIEDFSAGYMQRVMHLFPKQGDGPWSNTQDYALDKKMIRNAPLEDGSLIFDNPVGDIASKVSQSEPAKEATRSAA
ncbi:MAG: NAD(P)/FAD-dependent oxidoreductase [Proteobacteria bacterium]|nr:NAD(P)/FAD-dependent oxidoreductase [Pseudomonadota bacterium]